MMSLKRIFGLMLLFLFFEAVVAVVTVLFFSPAYVLQACLAMTGLAVLTWVIFVVLTRLLSRPKKAKAVAKEKTFVPAVAAKAGPGDDSFTLEFTGLVDEANRRLTVLGASAQGGVPATVQTLPLYLVVGAEGSGKTTALVNSGMEPRLLAGEAQKDGQVVPTGLANIWFAEGAIFVEVAGRVLMQEPERWEKALRVLAAQKEVSRWQRWLGTRVLGSNLRGVLLACDTGMLIQARDVHRLGTMARTLNERLQAVQQVMRADFPTYVLLTQCDVVRYFQEFFEPLSEAESRQVLGATLPVLAAGNEAAEAYSDREGGRLTKCLNRLYQSLADKRMVLLAREELTDKRALAYEFPREMKKVRGELVRFLLEVFRPATMATPCRLRGFYFSGQRLVARGNAAKGDNTSSVLDGSLDYSILKRPSEATVFFQSSSRSSTLDYSVVAKKPADMRVSKQTFLSELFREIILMDPAGRTAVTTERVGDLMYLNVALASCGLVLLVLSVVWVFAWQHNFHLLTDVEAAVRSVPLTGAAGAPAEVAALPGLETLRPAMVVLHGYRRDGAPLGFRWGMYAGNQAAQDVDSLYWTEFRQAVLDPSVWAMGGRFMELRPDSPVMEDVYKELKSYRTVTSGRCKPDAVLVASVMMPVWSGVARHDDAGEALAERQVQFYASELKYGDPYGGGIPENAEAVERAQVYLQDLTGPGKILQALLNQVRDQPAERLSGYAGNYSQVLTGPDQVDGPYTTGGWRAVEESIREHKLVSSGEPCVVGKDAGGAGWSGDAGMDAQVQKLYSDSYLQAWKQFLEAHHVVPFTGTPDAAQKLRTLADNNRSPLLALVYMTSANTNVATAQNLREAASEGLQRLATGAATTVQQAVKKFGVGGKDPVATPVAAPTTLMTVSTAFDPVHATVDPRDAQKWLNEKNQPYMKALGDLSDALQTLPTQVHVDVPLETQELQGAKTALLAADSALHGLAANFPNTASGVDVDLQNLLREPLDQARRVISGVVLVKAPLVAAGGLALPAAAPAAAPADPAVALKLKATIRQVNVAAVGLCSTEAALGQKFPFDATASTDMSMEELNGLLQPGLGAYPQFASSPEVQRAFNHAGRTWAAKPEFPATYSQQFAGTLSGLAETEDELYGEGSTAPHVDLTLTVDGTGKIPFELDVDGHTIKFVPGKPTPPLRLVWPPVTNTPTRLVLKTGGKGGGTLPAQYPGVWGLFHLLQAADDQSGNVFTFRSVRFANSLMPLTNDKGGPATVQIRIESAASNLFGRGYFAKLRCGDTWALQGQSPGN